MHIVPKPLANGGLIVCRISSLAAFVLTATSIQPANAGFVWQTPWQVTVDGIEYETYGSAWAAFGPSATAHGQITDIGQSGDQGPAVAMARVSAQAIPDRYTEANQSVVSARVAFSRTFEITDAPYGWQLKLDSHLTGSLHTASHPLHPLLIQTGFARINGNVRIVGDNTDPQSVSHEIALSHSCFSQRDSTCALNVSQADLRDQVLPNGTYSVVGSIEAYSLINVYSFSLPPVSRSRFFDLPAWTVAVDAVQWNPELPPGDFNADGTVDAADYVVWRKGLGTTYAQNDYSIWRSNFGKSAGSGQAGYPLGASAEPLSAAVPEPGGILLWISAVGAAAVCCRRRSICSGIKVTIVALATFTFLASTARPAGAAMFSTATVTELISAINAANQNAEPDSIALAPATTFTLTEVNNTMNRATGLPVISASEQLTIVGNGSIIERSATTGTPAFRLLNVGSGASLKMENLTLQGGLMWEPPTAPPAQMSLGGGIWSAGNLTLSSVIVQNNTARGANGSTCVIQCSGSGGPGKWGLGGGIYSAGSLLLQDSTLRNNQALGGPGGRGPAGGNRGGDGLGGGLFAVNGTVTMRDSSVTGNVARGGMGSGPGIADGRGVGGGIYNIYSPSAQITLDEFTFDHVSGNTASTSNPDIWGTYEIVPNPLPSDFNHDGTVDAADYVVWRKSGGTQEGYNTWRTNFGRTAGNASAAPGSAGGFTMAVPEPASLALVCIAILSLANLSAARYAGRHAAVSS